MSKSKPIDELTIDDLQEYPIWERATDSEGGEERDETWVEPVETDNFTEDLNGSIVLGEANINDEKPIPIMCSIDVERTEATISSIIFYDEERADYYTIEDRIKQIDFPLSITIKLRVNGAKRKLTFNASKISLYRNNVTTNLL